jgi:hypothetical protein
VIAKIIDQDVPKVKIAVRPSNFKLKAEERPPQPYRQAVD